MAAQVPERFTPAPSATAVADPAAVSAPPPADLFTLQVAAHLKQEYALKLVEDLKKKGLDAYWIETVSGGKTWYQVRIAHFPDQASAREFGRNLKWKGVIDDFYVTAYIR
jgi:cell division septation protein DedD